jgi:hypothetical protein
VRDQNAIIRGGAGKDVAVIRAEHANIVNPDNVEIGLSRQQPAHQIGIDVLIG